jgi:hypothetical protein
MFEKEEIRKIFGLEQRMRRYFDTTHNDEFDSSAGPRVIH